VPAHKFSVIALLANKLVKARPLTLSDQHPTDFQPNTPELAGDAEEVELVSEFVPEAPELGDVAVPFF
jgi:hypothetical protein